MKFNSLNFFLLYERLFIIVMVTVAKSFDAPIKLLFPQDLIENGILSANKFAMLGLGLYSARERL